MSDINTGRTGTPLGDALREIAELRGLLAETVPDPEYRRMQDIEIERLREERKRLREALIDLVQECEEYARINHLHNDDGSPATTGAMKHAYAALAEAAGQT